MQANKAVQLEFKKRWKDFQVTTFLARVKVLVYLATLDPDIVRRYAPVLPKLQLAYQRWLDGNRNPRALYEAGAFDGIIFSNEATILVEAISVVTANAEITDMVDSIGRNGDLFLSSAVDEQRITAEQASALRTHLSFALEAEKPVADCENGLATQTRAAKTQSFCFSPELLSRCAQIRDAATAYAVGIAGNLQAAIVAGGNAHGLLAADNKSLQPVPAAFVDAITARGAIATAHVRCASYDATAEDVFNGAGRVPNSAAAAVVAMVTATAMLLGLVV
ncbi:hypothetical protein JKP88DRAFT_247927 [Tribonema minus]|uniref:Uncharacterized protein n=1 Tax=Tribonema minus TaxID=303371 RepID=A0A836CAY6_9STRA|nr:hypothetical protein JKP88DRAFT_247927 [Tribonema minus]